MNLALPAQVFRTRVAQLARRSHRSRSSEAILHVTRHPAWCRYEQFSFEPMAFSRLNKTENFNDFPVVCDYFLRSYTNDNLGVVLLSW